MATNRQPEDGADKAAVGKTLAARVRAIVDTAWQWLAAKRAVLAMAVGALLLFALGAAGLWVSFATARLGMKAPAALAQALDALDRGGYVEARHVVRGLLESGDLDPEQLGGPAFVLGVVTFYETAEGWVPNRAASYLLAARHLEDARDRGFPPGRRAEGLFLLGKSLYLAGRYAACRAPLQEALDNGWQDEKEVHRLLTDACLRDANPKLEQALHHNSEYLASTQPTAGERAEARVERSRILFELGRTEECREVLRELPAEIENRADVIVLKGRLLLGEARAANSDPAPPESPRAQPEANSKYREAIRIFRLAQAHDTLDRQATRTSMYLIGVCMAEMGENFRRPAISQLTRTRKLHFDTPEGLAASLLEADLLREMKRGKEAVSVYRLAMSAAGDPLEYSNPWLPLDEFRTRVFTAYEALANDGQFDHAVEMLNGFRPMFSKPRTLELTARTAHRWGEAMIRAAEHLPESQARPQRRQARRHFREAGHAYLRLAEAGIASRRYPDDLWRSAQSLLQGHDFETVRRILGKYLGEQSPRWRPQALVGLAKANMALGHVDEAIEGLRECIDFHPRDATTYTARLWCSKAYLEKGEHQNAEELLRENLTSDSLTPASIEWRQSLFALGELLFVERRYDEAIEKLEEAVARYADAAAATRGTYLIGKAYREAAREPQERLRQAAVQTVRVASRRQVRELLDRAYQYYSQVQTLLRGREERSGLSVLDAAMLRNCFLARGTILFDLGRYAEAIEVYSDAATRFQNEPVVLEMFLQTARCYRRQTKSVEARGALEQAKVVLKHLPADEDFTITTNYSRDEWVALLDRLSI